MQRASKIDAGERRKLKQQAQAIREDCAEARQRLAVAESQIISLAPEAARVKGYVSQFRWDMVRKGGMPTDVGDHLRELNQCQHGGLHLIRETIRKIDEFSEADLAGKWRPSKDVGGIVANAGHAEQMLGALQRDLEYWGKKLEEGIRIAGGYEAVESERPPASNDRSRVIANIGPDD
jgi:hypothetical protein